MAGCRVNGAKSPDFSALCNHWRKRGFPSAEKDAAAVFLDIARNFESHRCSRLQRFDDVLQGCLMFKYRFKDSARREGARGGWRMIAVLDPKTQTLYPIMIYPKKEWESPGEEELRRCVDNLANALRQTEFPDPLMA